MKHLAVIFSAYFISIFLVIAPYFVYVKLSSDEFYVSWIASFLFFIVLFFPFVVVFMTIHHFVFFFAGKWSNAKPGRLKRIVIGSLWSSGIAALLMEGAQGIAKGLIFCVSFALVYELTDLLLAHLKLWTLSNQWED